MEWKYCPTCRVEKPHGAFRQDQRRPCGLTTRCRRCVRIYRQRWYWERRDAQIAYAAVWKRRNPEKVRGYGRLFRHGITVEQFEALAVAQGGVCAICGIAELKVDHCHVRKVIRGLLCDRCNRGLGYFDDDPERLERAAEYARREGVMPHVPRTRHA